MKNRPGSVHIRNVTGERKDSSAHLSGSRRVAYKRTGYETILAPREHGGEEKKEEGVKKKKSKNVPRPHAQNIIASLIGIAQMLNGVEDGNNGSGIRNKNIRGQSK